MVTTRAWADELRTVVPADWPAYLNIHSGLPGPRANTALAQAVAEVADSSVITALLADGGEYVTMCAATALGRRANIPRSEEAARTLAADERWRVREGVCIGLQLLGDADLEPLTALVRRWVDDPSLLVQRAAVATICEPRLLRTPDAAASAIDICRKATAHLQSLPQVERKHPAVRTLRQALGYCWSVAVAADPAPGLVAFSELDTADKDVAWIVRSNRGKKRLAKLLE